MEVMTLEEILAAEDLPDVRDGLRCAIRERNALLAANRDCVDHFEQMKVERDALRKRIAGAPVGIVDEAPSGDGMMMYVPRSYIGARVRVVLDDA